MPATIVVGAQFGSEGKGKVVALIARSKAVSCVIRCGGPNSGHTTRIGNEDRVLRQLPSSVGISDALVAIPAGAVIDVNLLISEVESVGIHPSRIVVDPRVVVVTEEDYLLERSLSQTIGGTASGNGRALARRLLRDSDTLAEKDERLRNLARVEPVAPLVHSMINNSESVIIEGTQGFGLSLFHGQHYPYVTSKDTTASGFASEVGLSPRDVNEIVMVVRTFPIRVGGPSGPLVRETSWEAIQQLSNAPAVEPEFTSVTNRLRRVAEFDLELVKSAAQYNRPTSIAVMGLDRLEHRNRCVKTPLELTSKATDFLNLLKCELDVPIDWIGTGFGTFDAISLRHSQSAHGVTRVG